MILSIVPFPVCLVCLKVDNRCAFGAEHRNEVLKELAYEIVALAAAALMIIIQLPHAHLGLCRCAIYLNDHSSSYTIELCWFPAHPYHTYGGISVPG